MTKDRRDPQAALWDVASTVIQQFAQDPERAEQVARLFAAVLPSFLRPEVQRRYFSLWQEHGVHVTRVQRFSPVPDTRTLPDELWARHSEMAGVDINDAGQLRLLREFSAFQHEYDEFPSAPTSRAHEFHFNNDSLDGTDALALYCMIRHVKPRLVLEVGSGFSSRLAAQALLRNGQGRLICIDQNPDALVKRGFPGLTSVLQRRPQDVHLDFYRQLQDRDVLLIDSSHVSTCGSDVNYLLLDVLPSLAPGVVVHLHDIFLPYEYPRDWVRQELRFWNEQYLLQAFLAFNTQFEVLLSNSYLAARHPAELRAAFPRAPWWAGGSFWLRRAGGEARP